jgi:hypothetical protein
MIHQNVQIAGDCYDIVAAKLDDPPSEVSRKYNKAKNAKHDKLPKKPKTPSKIVIK